MNWVLVLTLLWTISAPVQAEELPRAPIGSDVELQRLLSRIRRNLGNATIVTSTPNGSRRGRYGDQLVFKDGDSYRLCTNSSSGPDGGTTWNCDLKTDTTMCFEGTTSNDFETCFSITDPTADRTVTVRDRDGTLMLEPGSEAQGDVLYHNGTLWTRLAAGTSGYFLQTSGAGANPAWANVPITVSNIISFSRTDSQGTGSASYTGMGFQSIGLFIYCDDDAADTGHSWGWVDDDADDQAFRHDATTVWYVDTAGNSIYVEDISAAGNRFTGAVTSLDADGLTISWTETGTGPDITCKAYGIR